MLKKGLQTNIKLKDLKKISELAYTLSNNKPVSNQPYVGANAFAHKGGIHVDAISKGASYEHIDPSLVGNKRNIILSDLSGKANIVEMLKSFEIKDIDKNDKRVSQLLKKIESLEQKGYDLGDLDAEKYLLYKEFFDKTESIKIKSWEMKSKFNSEEFSECKIIGIVHGKEKEAKVEVAGGPVEAAYNSLKKFIESNHKNIINVKLINYKVRIAEEKEESSTVRVYIKFVDEKGNEWANVGVDKNILQASFEAIEKGFRYYLVK
jgi:2-isopropylmalate synthase